MCVYNCSKQYSILYFAQTMTSTEKNLVTVLEIPSLHTTSKDEIPLSPQPTFANISNLINIELDHNIFNAYLIAAYKPNCVEKWKQLHPRIRLTLALTAYVTAIVQFAAVFILVIVNYFSIHNFVGFFNEWNLLPYDWRTLILWPFFMIGLCLIYKEVRNTRYDIWALQEFGINNKNNSHLHFLKYVCELYLFYLGGFAYFLTLSLQKLDTNEDAMNIVLNILAYTYIFELDEWAYDMIKKDLVLQNIWNFDEFFVGCVSGTNRFTSKKASLERLSPGIPMMLLCTSAFYVCVFSRSYLLLGIDLVCSTVAVWYTRKLVCVCGRNDEDDGSID